MKGVGGKPGWAWIFILEGLATVVIGVASFWFVHDFPDEATFLSDEDRRRVIRRLKLDNQSSAEHEEFKMEYFWATLKDWKTYCFMVIYMVSHANNIMHPLLTLSRAVTVLCTLSVCLYLP